MSFNPSSAIIGEIRSYAGFTAPAGWLFPFGQSVLRSTYAALFTALTTAHTVTFSSESGELLCTWTGHPFQTSGSSVYTPVSFTAGTSTPTGITSGTVYFVKSFDANTFKLSTTAGGANIAYTNSGTGTQTATALFYGAADSTHFNLPDLRGRGAIFRDNMGGSAAGRMTGSPTGSISGIVLGNSGGEEGHTLVKAETPLLDIDVKSDIPVGGADSVQGSSGDPTDSLSNYINAGGGNAHNNVQPAIILNAIIYTGV